MKSTTTILKNLKLLFRSKASALVVLLAPLLIVLIVGVSFVDSDTRLNVGVVGSEYDLGQRLVESLGETNNIVDYNFQEDCVRGITDGFVVACIIIPQEADFGNNVTVKFYVDESRMNLVYRIISSVSTNLGDEQIEISQELTQDILSVLDINYDTVQSINSKLEDVLKKVDESKKSVTNTRSVSTSIDTTSNSISMANINSDLNSLKDSYSSLRSKSKELVDTAETFLLSVPDSDEKANFTTKVSSLKSFINSASGNKLEEFDDLIEKLGGVTNSFNSLRAKLDGAKSGFEEISKQLNSISSILNTIESELLAVVKTNNDLINLIDSLEYTSAETISRPFNTHIETVTSQEGNLIFAFPYLLGLVVMLIGIMLSSTLVFIEKDSRAHFRNFTTPTKSFFFLFMTYLTAIMIIFVQVIVILAFAYFLLGIPVLDNLEVSVAVLFVGISIFVFIGMLIGKLFNTSEAITMANIAIGSIFLFLSNLVLPLETLPENIRRVIDFNPYVTVSESLRQAFLFNSSFLDMQMQLFVMLAYSLVLIVLISILTKFSSIRIKTKKDSVINVNGARLFVYTLEDLIKEIESLNSKSFDEASKNNDVFRSWLISNKYKKLAKKIKGKNKEETLDILKKKK